MAMNTTNERTLADEVKTTRAALGISQARLADLLGVRQATISDWENGKGETLPEVVRLALWALEQRAKPKRKKKPKT